MFTFDEDKLFFQYIIRDTNLHYSEASNNKTFYSKNIAIQNDLNQPINIQLQGSSTEDFSKIFNIGSSFQVSANSTGYEDSAIYFPYIRVQASCLLAPTIGTLTIFLWKRG